MYYLYNIIYNRQYLQKKIKSDLGINCYAPANGVCVNIDATYSIPISVSRNLLKRQLRSFTVEGGPNKKQKIAVMDKIPVQGILVINSETKNLQLLDPNEAMDELGLVEHNLYFESNQKLSYNNEQTPNIILQELFTSLNRLK